MHDLVDYRLERELLLKVCLLARPEALSAWEEWKSRFVLEEVSTYDTNRLLPAAYRALSLHGCQDKELEILKGIYLKVWYKNQTRLERLLAVLRSFHEHKIATMLLKGAALQIHYYQDFGIRPMRDADVLVPEEQVSAAIALLETLAWSPKKPRRPGDLLHEHALCFTNAHCDELDLHWHVFRESATVDKELWSRAIDIDARGVPTKILHPTDHLIHLCQHARTSGSAEYHWVLDLAVLLQAACSQIDWAEAAERARKYKVLGGLKTALSYVSAKRLVELPAGALAYVMGKRLLPSEKIKEFLLGRGVRTPLGGLFFRFYRYLGTTGRHQSPATILGFIKFMKYSWGASTGTELFRTLLDKFLGIQRRWALSAKLGNREQ